MEVWSHKCYNDVGVHLDRISAKAAMGFSEKDFIQGLQDVVDKSTKDYSKADQSGHVTESNCQAMILRPDQYDELESNLTRMEEYAESKQGTDGCFCLIHQKVPVADFSKSNRGFWQDLWGINDETNIKTKFVRVPDGSAICRNVYSPSDSYNPDRLREFQKKHQSKFANDKRYSDLAMTATLAEENGYNLGIFELSRETAKMLDFLEYLDTSHESTGPQSSSISGTCNISQEGSIEAINPMDQAITETVNFEPLEPTIQRLNSHDCSLI
ncbi:hypothetical protein I302_107646 [Kwoniella bestiolae CBS 10118]|uniref:Uncharacterized protein n=1 Tax=Kwoniella bestiolae CBS 10118 TaxID=1296100 RepID=A0A1B9FXZ4_9TREE|nr:hypothetical protein I302_06615 [Kwoniella bestiolae CBS 10118]OCF23632.1 hypothetical protein I302_06615 [Kwoniella bestiolae CBS 10118]